MDTIAQNSLPGKWLVVYNPLDENQQTILSKIVEIGSWLETRSISSIRKDIVIDSSLVEEGYWISEDTVYLRWGAGKLDNVQQIEPGSQPFLLPKKCNLIKGVRLYFPFLVQDKRWQTINLTSSSIFLGSMLSNHGYNVDIEKLMLPSSHITPLPDHIQLAGFTLFEDLLQEFKKFLEEFATINNNSCLLAAGGPLVTLNPWQAAYHLPQLNLLIRGEGEIILPDILEAISSGDLETLLTHKGLMFREPGILILSDFQEINRVWDFSKIDFNFDFTGKNHLAHGLEINFSRGCNKGCLFCSKIQGRELRKLPVEKIEQLLQLFSKALDRCNMTIQENPFARTLNINDDDILQNLAYTRQVLSLTKKNGFKLWGIQASLVSFFQPNRQINMELLNLLADPELFVKGKPLVWLGTDTFLKARGKRLGKLIPSLVDLQQLVTLLGEQGISNYHYWISSDYDSSWAEFITEFLFISDLSQKNELFSIIGHSPFLIPYSSTPLHHFLSKDPLRKDRLKYKGILNAPHRIFTLPLAGQVDTSLPFLNKLLQNETPDSSNQPGFFDLLKAKDYKNALLLMYHYLKQERLALSANAKTESKSLLKQQDKLEERLAEYYP